LRVLGIDPGSHRTGWGVIDLVQGRLLHVASGVVQAGQGSSAERLRAIADGLDEILARFAPQAVAIETVFHAKNAQSALLLGQARGVALLCVARAHAPVFEYTAGRIKQAATGRGRAEKAQVQSMVRLLLGLSEQMALDTSDALAAAICHAQTQATPQAAFLSAVLANSGKRRRVRTAASRASFGSTRAKARRPQADHRVSVLRVAR
jgi:crossover junction endodeoxyribonuclease RuvC